jgi:hypothetical protein
VKGTTRQIEEMDMLTMDTQNTRRSVSVVAAVAIVAFGGLVLDQGHTSALRSGTVEVGELTPIGLEKLAQVTLPEIFITAERPATQGQRFASDAKSRPAGSIAVAAGTAR